MIALNLYINFGGKVTDILIIIYLPIYKYGIYVYLIDFLKVKLTLCFRAKTPLVSIYNLFSCIALFYLLMYSFRDFISFLIKNFLDISIWIMLASLMSWKLFLLSLVSE